MKKLMIIGACLLSLTAMAQNAPVPQGPQGQMPPMGQMPPQAGNQPRQWGQDVDRSQNNLTLDMYFVPCAGEFAKPDAEGFIRRWTILEPIDKPNRSNTVFVDSYLHETFYTPYFANQMTILPKDGEKVKVGDKKLTWHSFDSKLYNNKIFRFSSEQDLQVYGVLFWVVTVINCDEDMENVRLMVGSNSASMWWLNGEETLILSGDRRMVADDAASKRITLKKGKNVLRGAIINGPGMSDYCVRFIDAAGNPIKNISISTK